MRRVVVCGSPGCSSRNQDIPRACVASWMCARLSMHPLVLGPPEERGMAGDVL